MQLEFSATQFTLLGLISFINLYTFCLFYSDKKRAVKGKKNRISEKKLLITSLFVGGIGGLLGMFVIRHKTKHTRFRVLIPLAALLTVSAIFFVWNL